MFSTDLDAAPLPTRGMFYSVVSHVIFLLAVMAVPWNYWMPSEAHLVPMQSQVRAEEALLLPDLEPMGSGSPAAPSHNGGHGDRKKVDVPAASAEAKASQGVVYQGPQVIVSNPAHPDNFVQTIRQPDLPAPKKLPAPLNIPPMVSIAPAKPVLAPQPPQPETPQEAAPVKAVAVLALSLPQELPKVDAPKLPLPTSNAQNVLNAVASAPVPAKMPKFAAAAPTAAEVNGTQNILVVNALPLPNIKPSALPRGELNGAFTVSPTGRTSAAGSAGGGTTAKGAPGVGSATGVGSSPSSGTGINPAGGTGEGKGNLAGAGAGTAAGTGVGNGAGNGNSNGSNLAGNGSGTGTGHGSGSGGSANTGTGTSPFPSIMIQGGSGGSGSRASNRVTPTGKPQNSYGITIVASGASGGGFKDYGIFKEGASYTVYVDMADAGLRSSWTMQYAMDLHSSDPSDPPPQPNGVLVPPFALTKTIPHFTAEESRRSRGGTILVFGVIDAKGKWETLRVMHTPDPGLNKALLDALTKWTFQPAQLDGSPVPVKLLLGVVVNSIPVE
jgi:hypothetical protein